MIENLVVLLVSLGLIATSLAFGAATIIIFYKSLQARRDAIRSRNWPFTQGRVISTKMVWVGGRSKSPQPQIKYSYQVNDTVYEGSRIAFEFGHVYTLEAAEKLIEHYPVGMVVNVYYDPNRPQLSTLEQSHFGIAFGLIVSAVLLFSPTGLCLCAGLIGLADALKR